MSPLSYLLNNGKIVLLLIIAVFISGVTSYFRIPRASSPDITVPITFVNVQKAGYSALDAVDLLAIPMEREFSTLEDIDTMRTFAGENYAGILLRFDASVDMEKTLEKVNMAVDKVQSQLPEGVDRPTVVEFKADSRPISRVTLLGDAPARYLSQLAVQVKKGLESLPSVLDVELYGDRKEIWEVVVDPQKMNLYNMAPGEVIQAFSRNDVPVASGNFEGDGGVIPVSISGKAYSREEIESIVVRTDGNSSITIGDVSSVSYSMSDEKTIFRVNGKRAVTLLPMKRTGANLIKASEEVRALAEQVKESLPSNVSILVSSDLGVDNENGFRGLVNTILASATLVMLLSLISLGTRSAFIIGSAIPLSFLMSIAAVYYVGWTLNSMVLFALLTSSGLLVDMAVVVVEVANRLMRDKGFNKVKAYKEGAKMMSTPIIASSLTTIVVFIPLGFWPGTIGEFMVYFPMTVVAVLSSTLLVSLVFIPYIGSLYGGKSSGAFKENPVLNFAPLEHRWSQIVSYAISSQRRIYSIITISFLALVVAISAQFTLGKGVELFPSLDTKDLDIEIYTKSNLSLEQKEAVFKRVEDTILSDNQDFVRIDSSIRQDRRNRDFIGKMVVYLKNWKESRPFKTVQSDLRKKLDTISDLTLEIKKHQDGPPQTKDVELVLVSNNQEKLREGLTMVEEKIKLSPNLRDLVTDKNQKVMHWSIDQRLDKSGMAQINLQDISGAIMMMSSQGFKLGERNTPTSPDAVDVIARFPQKYRSLGEMESFRINSKKGPVPMVNVSNLKPVDKMILLKRYNRNFSYDVSFNVEDNYSAERETAQLIDWFRSHPISQDVDLKLEGSQKDMQRNQRFLGSAFIVAMMSMLVILVATFKSFYKSFIVLTAVLMSTAGVFLGLLVTMRPFSLIMTGLGIIALAGIIVNNNIVLIDAYQKNLAALGRDKFREAIVLTARERLRPILLMVMTSVIALTPAVFQVSVDVVGREINFNDPAIQITKIMSTALSFGLIFATPLTLLVTPCLLAAGETFKFKRFRQSIGKALLKLPMLAWALLKKIKGILSGVLKRGARSH